MAITTNLYASDNKEALIPPLAQLEAQIDEDLCKLANKMWPNVFDTLNKEQQDQYILSKFYSFNGTQEGVHKIRAQFQNLYELRRSYRNVIKHLQESK